MSDEIRELIGVFNGDGGVRGELAYALGKLRGTAECALCDLTHRGVRTNPEWKNVVCDLAIPFDLVHRNERSAAIAAITGERTPAVVAVTDDGERVIMWPDDFVGVAGDAGEFVRVLRERVAQAGLAFPGATSEVL
ncbi:hypothetical protein HNP11_004219 [Tsukamurella ocularis]|uniref:hypothetical protein n=1 Tax=Tsukamurella ocularis TaxID=1970234 RepID=UPI002166F0DF|nr:hypothetical protein [Tsukamurella ocularis]MCS3790020.1 hypothetical protein [Tsukamurella ocularis]